MILATIVLGTALQAGAAPRLQCPMKPLPVPVTTIARSRNVRSHVNSPDLLSASILLKDGTMIRVVNSGCDKSGGKLLVWVNGEVSRFDANFWLQESLKYSRVAFQADISKDLEVTIKQAKFAASEGPDSIFHATARSSEFLMFTVVVKPVDEGFMLSVSYVLG